MQYFTINDKYTVVCKAENTRNGFRHVAILQKDGWRDLEKATCNYINRTWERYTFESVLQKLVAKLDQSKAIALKDRFLFSQRIKGQFLDDDTKAVNQMFGSVAMIAKFGDILTNTKKESTDWKARMLQAGLPGLSLPDDWDTLDDDTKASRLDAVIGELSK